MTPGAQSVRNRGARLLAAALGVLAIATAVAALAREVRDREDGPGQTRACRSRHASSHRCRPEPSRPAANSGQAPRPGPAISRQGLITSSADGDSTDGGNAWGPDKLRIVRGTTVSFFS